MLQLDHDLCEYGRLVIDLSEGCSASHRSTGLYGTLRGLLGREGVTREGQGFTAEAVAYAALELYALLGVQELVVSGGNASPDLVSRAQVILDASGSSLSVSLSPVAGLYGCAPLFTTALGASLIVLGVHEAE